MAVNFSSMLPSFSHGLLSNIGLLLGSKLACFLPFFFHSSHSPCLRVKNIYQLHYRSPSIYLFKSMFFQRKCFGNEASQQERSPDRLMLSMSAQVTLAKMCLFFGFWFWHFFFSFFWWKFSYFLPLGVHTFLLEYPSFLHDPLQGLQTNRQPPIAREQWVFPNSLAGGSWPCLGEIAAVTCCLYWTA